MTYNLGVANGRWNPNPTAATIHKRIRRYRGSAKTHNCVDCGKQAYDWSWIHDTDPLLMDSYEPRCRSCHLKYDPVRGAITFCEPGCTCKRHNGNGGKICEPDCTCERHTKSGNFKEID